MTSLSLLVGMTVGFICKYSFIKGNHIQRSMFHILHVSSIYSKSFVCFDSIRPSQLFSAMSLWVYLGFTAEFIVPCSRTQHSASGEAPTCNPSISSQWLYQWTTMLLIKSFDNILIWIHVFLLLAKFPVFAVWVQLPEHRENKSSIPSWQVFLFIQLVYHVIFYPDIYSCLITLLKRVSC